MVFKHVILSGLLIFISLLPACSSSSSKKGPAPVSTQDPKLDPAATPVPTTSPAASGGQETPLPKMIGDWQSTFSDPNYFGNVTYTFREDGHVLLSLLIYGKGKKEIMAERHEFKGTFFPSQNKLQLEHVKGHCTVPNSKPTMTFSLSEIESNTMYLIENASRAYFRLSKVKGGLAVNVHSADRLNEYAIRPGCFTEGRMNQFAPQEG